MYPASQTNSNCSSETSSLYRKKKWPRNSIELFTIRNIFLMPSIFITQFSQFIGLTVLSPTIWIGPSHNAVCAAHLGLLVSLHSSQMCGLVMTWNGVILPRRVTDGWWACPGWLAPRATCPPTTSRRQPRQTLGLSIRSYQLYQVPRFYC